MRARICASMKRYFHTKSIEGLLSNKVCSRFSGLWRPLFSVRRFGCYPRDTTDTSEDNNREHASLFWV